MTLLETIEQNFSSDDNTVSNFTLEKESKEYDACTFCINTTKIIYRKAKTTPKKEGQFVTFYKRIPSGIIAPFEELDSFDFLIISAENEIESGYFIFPKSILVDKQILSTMSKEGKRAFRIYPPWSLPKNKQALTSQNWQLHYFIAKDNLDTFLRQNSIFQHKKNT